MFFILFGSGKDNCLASSWYLFLGWFGNYYYLKQIIHYTAAFCMLQYPYDMGKDSELKHGLLDDTNLNQGYKIEQ